MFPPDHDPPVFSIQYFCCGRDTAHGEQGSVPSVKEREEEGDAGEERLLSRLCARS